MKVLRIVQLTLWTAIAVGMTALLVYLLTANGTVNFTNWSWGNDFSTQLYSGSFDPAAIDKLALDTQSADIIFTTSSNDRIQVTCLGSANLKKNNPITVGVADQVLTLHQQSLISVFPFFNLGNQVRVEIALPVSYTKDLEITNTSGNITFEDDLTLGSVSINKTSGDLYSHALTATSFELDSTSGDSRIASLSARHFNIQNISGDTSINSLSGSGGIQSTSGNITASIASMTGSIDISLTSGDLRLTLAKTVSAQISAHCISGDINSNLPLSYTSHGNSASGKVGSGPYPTLSLSETSGDISIQQN